MTIPSWARVGAKVVCVDDYPDRYQRGPQFFVGLDGLRKDGVYTIRDVVRSPYDGARWGLRLVEIVRKVGPGDPYEVPFGIERFRPLVTIEDDIKTHFAQHLHTKLSEPV